MKHPPAPVAAETMEPSTRPPRPIAAALATATALAALFSPPAPLAAADLPAVAVVADPGAPALEVFAAKELAGFLEGLFGFEVASVATAAQAPAGAQRVLLGSPATNPAVEEALGEAWPPDLGEQGHLLKSTPQGLVLGGGSPAATLWAVYELAYRHGLRHTLHGDFPPVDAPEFRIGGFDEVLRPNLEIRAWRTLDPGPAGQEAWGLEDHRGLLRQLAKLKFNRIVLVLHPGRPFCDFESGAPSESDGALWQGETFPVDGDTAGRAAFRGAAVFENPDFAGAETPEERVAAGLELVRGIVAAARELGMEAVFEAAEAEDPEVPVIALGAARGGLLPHLSGGALPARLAAIREAKQRGFALRCPVPGGHSHDLHYLSRAAFAADLDPREALESLIAPTCGEGVSERVAAAFAAVEAVSALMDREDPGFAAPRPEMFLEHHRSAEPAPAWWAEAKELYGTAVNEMYRANTRARGGPRPYLLYHAKTFTFALHYLGAVEAVRAAGIARAGEDAEEWVGHLELSVEALHNALGIYADVARDHSDRGAIAVLNAYAYRPLLELLDEAPLE